MFVSLYILIPLIILAFIGGFQLTCIVLEAFGHGI